MDNNIITIQELLLWGNKNSEFEKEAKSKNPRIRLVRHSGQKVEEKIGNKPNRESLYTLYTTNNDLFMAYQNEQGYKEFKDIKYMVSFLGEEGTNSRFIGVFEKGSSYEIIRDNVAIFDFKKLQGFEKLEEKVVIDWGSISSTRAWIQKWKEDINKKKKYVIRIDSGIGEKNVPIFKSYADVKLNYHQLKCIIDNNISDWKTALEACNCVYLILDKHTGKQYVGVTYKDPGTGSNGIWHRWNDYVKTGGHGGNTELKKLYKKDNDYIKNNFQWCILEILDLNVSKKYAIHRESLYKEKFGTREHGYNNN